MDLGNFLTGANAVDLEKFLVVRTVSRVPRECCVNLLSPGHIRASCMLQRIGSTYPRTRPPGRDDRLKIERSLSNVRGNIK